MKKIGLLIGWLILVICGLILLNFISVIIHESGHAIFGMIFSVPIDKIDMGKTWILWKGEISNIKVMFGLLGNGGVFFDTSTLLAIDFPKQLAIFMAGNIFEVIPAWILYRKLWPNYGSMFHPKNMMKAFVDTLFLKDIKIGKIIFISFIFLSIISLYSNLLPLYVSDGAWIIFAGLRKFDISVAMQYWKFCKNMTWLSDLPVTIVFVIYGIKEIMKHPKGK